MAHELAYAMTLDQSPGVHDFVSSGDDIVLLDTPLPSRHGDLAPFLIRKGATSVVRSQHGVVVILASVLPWIDGRFRSRRSTAAFLPKVGLDDPSWVPVENGVFVTLNGDTVRRYGEAAAVQIRSDKVPGARPWRRASGITGHGDLTERNMIVARWPSYLEWSTFMHGDDPIGSFRVLTKSPILRPGPSLRTRAVLRSLALDDEAEADCPDVSEADDVKSLASLVRWLAIGADTGIGAGDGVCRFRVSRDLDHYLSILASGGYATAAEASESLVAEVLPRLDEPTEVPRFLTPSAVRLPAILPFPGSKARSAGTDKGPRSVIGRLLGLTRRLERRSGKDGSKGLVFPGRRGRARPKKRSLLRRIWRYGLNPALAILSFSLISLVSYPAIQRWVVKELPGVPLPTLPDQWNVEKQFGTEGLPGKK